MKLSATPNWLTIFINLMNSAPQLLALLQEIIALIEGGTLPANPTKAQIVAALSKTP